MGYSAFNKTHGLRQPRGLETSIMEKGLWYHRYLRQPVTRQGGELLFMAMQSVRALLNFTVWRLAVFRETQRCEKEIEKKI